MSVPPVPASPSLESASPDAAVTLPVKRSEIFGWCCFDFANSAFTTIIITVVYSKYFTSYVAADGSYQCRPLNAAAKAVRPTCAAGYQASYAAKDGSFGCRPLPKPAPKTQCPPDLVYFENANGTFGCRKPR